MFDPYAQRVVDAAGLAAGIDSPQIRRILSASYFWLLSTRLAVQAEDVPSRDRAATIAELRKLANTMESAAVFDPLRGVVRSAAEVEGAAFVGAEALALIADLARENRAEAGQSRHILADVQVVARIESGLMYMIGGFDVNSVAVIRPVIPIIRAELVDATPLQEASRRLAILISDFCRGSVRFTIEEDVALPLPIEGEVYESLVERLRVTLIDRLSRAVGNYMAWLSGADDRVRLRALEELEAIRGVSQLQGTYANHVYTEFGDVYHLAGLLIGAFGAIGQRSLVHRVPLPDGPNLSRESYQIYLRQRASPQDGSVGRPLLWPSALEYVDACLPGPHRDAVVSFPTGSGKSFVAELSISHALAHGWIVYLAPTNALCHQIRRDLNASVGRAFEIPVLAFVGGEEYTTLANEQFTESAASFIAVMTPEKCALALRLNREVFRHCRLCIVDECHIINDQRRGPVAELVLAEFATSFPEIRFLLMSAMVANPEDLVGWLNSLRARSAIPCSVKWRPSRAARSFVFLDKTQHSNKVAEARAVLGSEKKAQKIKIQIDLGWIIGLSGPWQAGGPQDYIVSRLSELARAEVARKRNSSISAEVPSWKNTTGRLVSERFAHAGLSTINFILSSRHHAFAQAEKAEGQPGTSVASPWPPVVDAWLRVADAELGVSSVLRDLFVKGIAVHTSAMLSVEQAASTLMFSKGWSTLMFATGTLAQGLNLPAVAIVISGSSIGDPRDTDRQAGLERANEIILNGFGRGGRPGFSNQAIVVLVSDNYFSAPIVADLDISAVLRAYPVLGEPDASVKISSKLDRLFDLLQLQVTLADLEELEVFGSLVARDEEAGSVGRLLNSTFGGYQRRRAGLLVDESAINLTIDKARVAIVDAPDVPGWLGQAATKAGASLNHTLSLYRCFVKADIANQARPDWAVLDWYMAFLSVMQLLPPERVIRYFASDDVKTPSVRTRLRDLAQEPGARGWEQEWFKTWDSLRGVVWRFMSGENYRSIASHLLAIAEDKIGNERTSGSQPVPAMFKFISEVVEFGLALDAGCFLAIYEGTIAGAATVPEPLAALPLCIRNGCDSLSTLAWFRFGLRERICAHELAKRFPVPLELAGDTLRAQWVRDTRRRWLSRTGADEADILKAARTIITQEEGS